MQIAADMCCMRLGTATRALLDVLGFTVLVVCSERSASIPHSAAGCPDGTATTALLSSSTTVGEVCLDQSISE
jgi:hypothetical protein